MEIFVMFPFATKAQTGISVDSLNGANGTRLIGGKVNAGSAIATGDINGDGIEDLFIGDRGDNAFETSGEVPGRVYVIFGNNTPEGPYNPYLFSLGIRDKDGYFGFDDIDQLSGKNGFVIRMNRQRNFADKVGYALSTGDINNDGYTDLIIGAPKDMYSADSTTKRTGRAYVVFGNKDIGSGGELDLSNLNGSNGYALNGIDYNDIYNNTDQYHYSQTDETGKDVATGDIDGDGYDDIIIGAPLTPSRPVGQNKSYSKAGEAYIVYGNKLSDLDAKDGNSDGMIQLHNLEGNGGYKLKGIDSEDFCGWAVSSGDINNDQYDDLIIGAPEADPRADTAQYNQGNAGETYVVYGMELATLDANDGNSDGDILFSNLNGSNGFRINGIDYEDESGRAVTSGNLNNDGFDDVIIEGVSKGDNSQSAANETYVVFGGSDVGSNGVFELPELDGTNGFLARSISISNDLIKGAATTGDINNDNVDDLIMGVASVSSNSYLAGQIYVLFGTDKIGSSGSVDLSTLDGSNGFVFESTDYKAESGYAVGAGDLNGDGVDELISGAPDAGYSGYGEAYIFSNARSTKFKGSEGFRTMSAPKNGTIFNTLLDPFWTQGFSGSDAPQKDSSNVWLWDASKGTDGDWVSLADQDSSSLAAGRGFLFQVYSDDNNDGTPEGFPKYMTTLEFGGKNSIYKGAAEPVNSLADGRFFLAGNPYDQTIDWGSFEKSNLSSTVYVYDHSEGSWMMWNGYAGNLTDGLLAPYQGFFIQGSGGNGSLSMNLNDISGGTTRQKKRKQQYDPFVLEMHVSSQQMTNAAWIQFDQRAKSDIDTLDGLELQPFANQYVQLYSNSSEGSAVNIDALPKGQDSYVIPLVMNIAGSGSTNNTGELTWNGLDQFPSDWSFTLVDTVSGDTYNLTQNQSVTVTLNSTKAKIASETSSSNELAKPVVAGSKHKSQSTRYELHIKTSTNTAINHQDVPKQVVLDQNYPNPFNPTTTIRYNVPEKANVTLNVYNELGQRVATLINHKQKAAGRYRVSFNASKKGLASGLYIYRLKVGEKVLTKKMTLIK